jgi:dephospho-CoA kinase
LFYDGVIAFATILDKGGSAMNIIIGVTGPRGAGKSELIKFLVEFIPCAIVLRMSDYVRREADELRGRGIKRDLREQSFAKRREFGKEYWIKKILADIASMPPGVFIIDGQRNAEGDIDYLRENAGCRVFIVGVTADSKTRLGRVKERNRDGNLTDRQIRRDLAADLRSGGECGFDLFACLERCDDVIINTSTLAELRERTRFVVEMISRGFGS